VSDNSSWWLLVPCGILTIAFVIVIAVLVRVVARRTTRPAVRRSGGSPTPVGYGGSPDDQPWTHGGTPPHGSSSHDAGSGIHGYGHTIDHGHGHGDSGSAGFSDSGSSGSYDSGSSGSSDSGSSGSSDSGSSSSSSD